MNAVFWLTCRSTNDLCATTHRALLTGLVRRGHEVTLVNPDSPEAQHDELWSHVHVSTSKIPGRAATSAAQHMRSWALNQKFPPHSVAVLDWRIARRMAPVLDRLLVPWTVLDRSPPAHPGFLSKLQWLVWRRAWQQVKNSPEAMGFVVSPSHALLVEERTGTSQNKIVVLPAGVDLDRFQPGERRQRLTMVYHGRLDKNRGVLALPMLVQKARNEGLDIDLVTIGEGDAAEGLKQIASTSMGIEVHPTMPQAELASLLSTCHIGLLPMPDTPVWAAASPLKQTEYAATGLLMLGIDHQGHRLRNRRSEPWLKLIDRADFLMEGVVWLKGLSNADLEQIGAGARVFAEAELSWDVAVEALHESLTRFANT